MSHEKWNDLMQSIKGKQLVSNTWHSDQASLLHIFEECKKMNINPVDALNCSLSNLRTIIKEAKNAIANNDPQRLSSLFHMAATLTVSDLRLAIGSRQTVSIPVRFCEKNGKKVYAIELTQWQFDRVVQSLKSFFEFSIIETEE